MSTGWNDGTFETFNDETTYGESPFGEAPLGEAPFGEPRMGEDYAGGGEAEWGSPFGETEEEVPGSFDYGQELGQEYGQEAYAGDTEAESVGEDLAGESEIMRGPTEFPNSCGDVTFDGKPWKFGRVNQNNAGRVSALTFVPRAEVFEFQLSDFDVDRHELKRQHRDAIVDFTKRVLAGVRANRYSGEPIRVFTYGEASSTAQATHNLPLSRNRAFNVLNAIRCEFQKAGITTPVQWGLYGTGEQHARVRGPNDKEDAQFRGVIVRAFAPMKACAQCRQPPGPRPPGPRPPQTGLTTAICVSVPKISPRMANKLPPDVIPLGGLIPGLRLPFAIVTKAQAAIRVDDRRSRRSGHYTFQGWGLEVALPAGRARVDLQAELRASIEVLVRASASLGARLQLGPLKLSLKVDLSVFAQLIVKLCAQLRLRLEADLGRPNTPELRQCQFLEARNVRGPFPFAALAGPAVLVVPGTGYGPAVLTLGSPAVAGLGLPSNVIRVPADKSTIRTLLAMGGTLRVAQAGAREAEHTALEGEWPEAFEEMQSELAAFV